MKIISNNKTYEIKNYYSFLKRFKGLMFTRKRIEHGILFKKCNSIHTFFCFQNIDIIMTDKNDNIILIIKDLKPNRIIYKKEAYNVLEFSSGLIDLNDFEIIN